MGLDFAKPADIVARAREILGWKTDLAFFPVRHHSPTGARQIERFLRKYKPDHILIEGPSAFNDRINLLADKEHEAPFALIAATRGDAGEVKTRSYYPMCDYSPELVALRVGKELGAKCRFIDLTTSVEKPGKPDETDRLAGAEDGPMAFSRFTRELVARTGCRDFDEVWEALFEQSGWDLAPEAWALDVTAYSLLARAPYSEEDLVAEGTIAREACMARHIADVVKKKGRVVVVTGAFHTVALRETEPGDLEKEGAEVFLAPYTFPRLDALLGYASGMSGPQFYQHVWDARAKDAPFAAAAQRILVEASRLARLDGEVCGTSDAIAALTFATRLAELRGRPVVGRAEVIEAATACFVKGDSGLVGARVKGAVAEAMRGKRVGKLGKSAGQSPLVTDFLRRCEELRIPIEHGRPDRKDLAIFASELDLRRSRFFHQCAYLELPFASKDAGPDLATGSDLHLTREKWSVQYTPEVDGRLVELAPLGAGVEDVATALLVQNWLKAEGKSSELVAHLGQGLVMGLHAPLRRLLPRLSSTMLSDDDVISLLGAGAQLRAILDGRERLEPALVAGLPALTQQANTQGALRLERLANLPPDRVEAALGVLKSLLDTMLTASHLAPGREMVVAHARAARDAARGRAPAILGALDGFLLQLGVGSASDLARALGTLARGKTRTDGVGAYLEGVLACARQALLGEGALLQALLEHIRDAEWNDFMATLPSLRRAFTQLTPAETTAVAERAAEILGISTAEATQLLAAPPEVIAALADWEKVAIASEKEWG